MKSLQTFLVVAALIVPSSALAQAKKKPAAKPAAGAAKKEESKGPKVPARPTGPADASAFAGDVDDSPEWFKKTDEVILQLTDLIKTLPEGDIKATRMIQLAEYYWQKSSRLHLKAVKNFNRIYDDWFLKDGASKGIPEPKLADQPAEKESDAVMQKAVSIYEFVIKKYPNHPKGDQAHYYLGNSYLQLTKKDQAVATLQKLVQRYPQSEFIPDAYLGLGEFFFENKKLPEAIENYTKAASYTKSKNYGYARYKLAWCYLNTGEPEKAVKLLKEVVAYSINTEAAGGPKLEYKEQALKDLVVAYADVGRVDEAEQYFQSVGGKEYFRKMLEYLGATYFAQGRDDESITIYRRLIALSPMDEGNLEYEGEILKAYIRKADRPQILSQLNRIVQMVKPESAWVKANQGSLEKIQSQRDSLEGAVSKYAREVYEESRKLNAEQSFKGFQQAEQFCDYYLQTFPKAKNAYPIRMMLAETQWKLAGHQLAAKDMKYRLTKYAQAGDSYLKVVEENPKGEHLSLASEGAIFAADKIIELVKSNRKDPKPPAGDFAPRELPEEEKLVVRACDAYIKYNPKGPKSVPTRYKAAYLVYEFNQFDEALKRFNDVIAVAPGSEQARFAADLILNVFEVRKDPASANAYARNFLKIPELAKGDYRKELQKVLENSQFAMVKKLEDEKKHVEAANAYLAFAKEFPTSDLADEAYYNASVAFVNGEQIDQAIKVRESFIKQFPDSPFTPDVIQFLGDNFRKVTEFGRAAEYYEMLATKHPKYKSSPDVLYNAALFRENLDETTKAIADYRLYLKQYPERPDAHEILFTIAEIYEKRKDTVNAIKTFEEYIKVYGKKSPDLFLDAKARIATMTYDKGAKKEAYLKYAEVTKSYRELVTAKAKIGPIGVGAAAKAAFFQVEPKFDEYAGVKMRLPQKVLANAIKTKIGMIKPLVGDYTKVVEYKHGDWAVASLYQVGRLSEEFVVSVKESPMPPELTTDTQKELYLYDMSEKFAPVEEAAIEFYQKCLDTSYDYRIYSDYTRKCNEGLERVSPSKFSKDPEIRVSAGTNSVAFESSPLIEVK